MRKLKCGCPKIDRFSMCINQEHLNPQECKCFTQTPCPCGGCGGSWSCDDNCSHCEKQEEKKDYIVVKTTKEALNLVDSKVPSLAKSWVIVAPNGLKKVSKEDIAKLPQVRQLLYSQQHSYIKRVKELLKQGHGGGNWRRLAMMLLADLEEGMSR